MYAIINIGNGRYYTSAVFGYYKDKAERSGRKHNNGRRQYYIVLDERKESLIRFYEYDQSRFPYLCKVVLITDSDRSDWVLDENDYGGVSFLSKEAALSCVYGKTPPEVLAQCRAYDAKNPYTGNPCVKTAKDIDDLMWAAGGFHDAFIERIDSTDDGLRVMFDGVWGCKIEVMFTGDVSYEIGRRAPEDCDIWWFDSTVAFHGGYIYLIDDYEVDPREDLKGLCWFRAKQMSYRIIPN